MLCKKKDENPPVLYAMKTLRKEALIKRGQLAHTSTERYILQNIHSPFLTHLKFAFQTNDKLYMVLEFLAGGELFFWLKKDKKFTENRYIPARSSIYVLASDQSFIIGGYLFIQSSTLRCRNYLCSRSIAFCKHCLSRPET